MGSSARKKWIAVSLALALAAAYAASYVVLNRTLPVRELRTPTTAYARA